MTAVQFKFTLQVECKPEVMIEFFQYVCRDRLEVDIYGKPFVVNGDLNLPDSPTLEYVATKGNQKFEGSITLLSTFRSYQQIVRIGGVVAAVFEIMSDIVVNSNGTSNVGSFLHSGSVEADKQIQSESTPLKQLSFQEKLALYQKYGNKHPYSGVYPSNPEFQAGP